MNDLLFLVADSNMREALRGFLERKDIHINIGCRRIAFDARRDILVAKGQNDPGLYVRASDILRLYTGAYRHAVVIMDEFWDGSVGAAAIRERLNEHLTLAGWPPPEGLGLVVCPEADVWLFSDSPHAAFTLGWESWETLRAALVSSQWLLEGETKPQQPKEAAEWALRQGAGNMPRSSALYRNVAEKVSVKRCGDPAFQSLLEALRRWFPPEV